MFFDFFGFGGYQREPEGYLSAEHLIFVSSLIVLMFAAAIYLGIRNKNRSEKEKNLVLIITALVCDGLEIFKIILFSVRSGDPFDFLYTLPLFLCSIQLITMPLAAFSKGRLREASLDFVLIFGLLGAILGTYGAGQNYACYPVLSFDNVVSGLTHTISGFAAVYIGISGLGSMKKKNIPITFSILIGFCAAAMIANALLDYNYMFLVRGDGTPYDLLYQLVRGNPVLYPMGVILLFILYISVFYLVYFLVRKQKAKKQNTLLSYV